MKYEIENNEDLKILNDIEEKIIKNIKLGYDPQILTVLDDEKATSNQIELLKGKLTNEIVTRLFRMANAVYFGKLLGGDVSSFFEATIRIGMQPAKMYIISLSIFSLSSSKEFKILTARSFATSVLGRMLAGEMGLHEREIKKVELGGLFLNIGKTMVWLYQTSCSNINIEEEFISKYSPYLGLKIIEKFKLPGFLNEIMLSPYFRFTEDSLHLSAVVNMANSIVENSFRKYGKLVIQSPLPDELIANTPGSIIEDQFRAIGLSEYLEIIPVVEE
ncbi:MAG: HDOD domain-containing protein [Nitrospirae bacterium]|nr:HDOD domain-containing protein [Nitrospirota bacterium]